MGFSLEARGEGTLVLGSDGLWKYVRWERVPEALCHPPKEAARRLLESVRYPSGELSGVPLALPGRDRGAPVPCP